MTTDPLVLAAQARAEAEMLRQLCLQLRQALLEREREVAALRAAAAPKKGEAK